MRGPAITSADQFKIGWCFTHVEEVVKEDESHCNSIGDVASDSKSYCCYCEAHRTSSCSEEHQFVAANSFDDKVCHGCPEHPLHGVGGR